MSGNETPADELRGIPMGLIWGITSGIVFVLVVLFAQLPTTEQLPPDDVVPFVAGYTFPLTVGFGVIAFLILCGFTQGD